MNTSSKIIFCMCALPLVLTEAEASLIRVINNNTTPLVMEIVPEVDSPSRITCTREGYLENYFEGVLPGTSSVLAPECGAPNAPICQKEITGLCNKNYEDLIVNAAQLQQHHHFAVNGHSGSIFFGGSCRNLNVSKDYVISFLNDDFGTTCIAEEA